MTINFYSGNTYEGLVNFSTAVAEVPFASELLTKLEASYEYIDDAVADIVEAYQANGYDVSDADVISLLTEEIPPSEEDLEILSGLYIDEDGEADELGFERLVNAALATQEHFLEDEDDNEEYEEEEEYEGEYEDDLEGEYEDDLEDEYEIEDDYEYEEGEVEDEQFNAAYSKVMEFAHAQELKASLDELIDYGAALVEDGKLAPIAFQMMFGTDDTNRVANFSRASQEAEIDDYTHLQSIAYALNLFNTIGQLSSNAGYRPLNFSSLSLEDIVPDSTDRDVDLTAQGIFAAYKQN